MFNKTSTFESVKINIRKLFGDFNDLFNDEEITIIAKYCIKNYHDDLVPYLADKLKNKVFEKDELLARMAVGL
jgi:hypothetical protein